MTHLKRRKASGKALPTNSSGVINERKKAMTRKRNRQHRTNEAIKAADAPRRKKKRRAARAGIDFFTVGSTRNEVLRIQGQPLWWDETTFHYGPWAQVNFNEDRVVSWSQWAIGDLNAKLLPTPERRRPAKERRRKSMSGRLTRRLRRHKS